MIFFRFKGMMKCYLRWPFVCLVDRNTIEAIITAATPEERFKLFIFVGTLKELITHNKFMCHTKAILYCFFKVTFNIYHRDRTTLQKTLFFSSGTLLFGLLPHLVEAVSN